MLIQTNSNAKWNNVHPMSNGALPNENGAVSDLLDTVAKPSRATTCVSLC